jgi:uncharacterized protein
VGQAVGAPLAARELPALFRRVHAALADRRDAIDDLNVFPVPDGDTGTNMSATVRAGLDALYAARREHRDVDELARAVIRGTVRGARGNSGVIISQVVRAVVEVVTGHDEVDARLYAAALGHARELAYEAVAEPVEGTILTVLGRAAEAARDAVQRGEDLVGTSAASCAATADAVAHTRQQLTVLREAGVVDAGARGFEVLLAAVHGHLTGSAPDVVVDAPRELSTTPDTACHGSRNHPYEVQYLLEAVDAAAGPLRDDLEALGESVVVVAAGGLLNVHVHTDAVGAAIDAGLSHGRPSAIEVVHLGDQVAALDRERAGISREDEANGDAATVAPRERVAAGRRVEQVAAVAVLSGPGAHALARELGAVVVDGAAGALPSVADLLDAIARTSADRVLLLPGHPNAIATATTAAEVAAVEQGRASDVIVEADNPPAVLAALAVCDAGAAPDQVLADVRGAAGAVRAGEVVAAVRDAETPIGTVRSGRPLAIAGGTVIAAPEGRLDALRTVLEALDAGVAEVVTLLHGAGTSREERDAAETVLGELAPGAELEVVDADSRPSAWWVGVE